MEKGVRVFELLLRDRLDRVRRTSLGKTAGKRKGGLELRSY
jgi:hypothetical protein